jgi:hypothetical protein
MAVVLSIIIISNLAMPQEAKASWFSDFLGGMFTVLTLPISAFCPNNPTFRKNNPFRQKEWEEDEERERNKYKPPITVYIKRLENKIKEIEQNQIKKEEEFEEWKMNTKQDIRYMKAKINVMAQQNKDEEVPFWSFSVWNYPKWQVADKPEQEKGWLWSIVDNIYIEAICNFINSALVSVIKDKVKVRFGFIGVVGSVIWETFGRSTVDYFKKWMKKDLK